MKFSKTDRSGAPTIATVWLLSSVLLSSVAVPPATAVSAEEQPPNILFILTDDQRWDCWSAAGNEQIATPNLDRIVKRGTRFTNAFVTLAICSPSRAACLTGRYGSVNGVTRVGTAKIRDGQPTFAKVLGDAGYCTGVTGKWHLKNSPTDCGFQFAATCWSNGTWYDRQFSINGKNQVMPGFVDDVTADLSIEFMQDCTKRQKPFVLWMNTQVPHMDHQFRWPVQDEFLTRRDVAEMPLPATWDDDLDGKPAYLWKSRSRTQALSYGYDDPDRIRSHHRDYYAAVEQMDRSVGRVLDELESSSSTRPTWVIFMGDNGWMLGEHGMTSKVLPYEESMRVPMAISGPNTGATTCDALVLNIDLTATIYALAGIESPPWLHGRSLLPLIQGETVDDWRTSILYEAPTPQLGSRPLWAVRDERWKYVETVLDDSTTFAELYDLQKDPNETSNLAFNDQQQGRFERFAKELMNHRQALALTSTEQPDATTSPESNDPNSRPTQHQQPVRTDIHISGVYPHLTTYGIYSQNGAHRLPGHNECGIGAVVPWAGKLWMVNYAPHMPRGSEHKLYSVDADLTEPMTVHSESVGGTPAGRMIHAESQQLLIAHYAIDREGKVRAISPKQMPIRVTAISRHLTDPANMVYYIDMEGSIWEANVHTLDVKRLFKKPVPGWHGKGGYTSQGRLVVSNNGELHVGNYDDVLVGGPAKSDEERGVLAEWDRKQWRIVERRQYTEVTGPPGIAGGSDGNEPVWAIGWDRRSLRLKVLTDGQWSTYLLPKAAYCNDASHGWYTEWPRIRQIGGGRWMMDMHGMFFDFPPTFSANNTAGIHPIASHLRYVPDFCDFNGQLVLASDETSIQGNPLAGQPQSNLWFGKYEDLSAWGPATAYGGPWVEDEVMAMVPSDPFLVAGFDDRCLHLSVGKKKRTIPPMTRASDQQAIHDLPSKLAGLTRIAIPRGDWHRPAPGFRFEVDVPVTVYLVVDQRGNPTLADSWQATPMSLRWGKGFTDKVYRRSFPAGVVSIPANASEHKPGNFGMPHLAFVAANDGSIVQARPLDTAIATVPQSAVQQDNDPTPVTFTLEVDRGGLGQWERFDSVTVPADGYLPYLFPENFDAQWLRLTVDRDCVATAFLHQVDASSHDGQAKDAQQLFAGLADIADEDASVTRVYPAKRNRNLRVITEGDRFFEFTKAGFEFQADSPDPRLQRLLDVEPEASVDRASVVVHYRGKTYRLPKGDSAFDRTMLDPACRMMREVESERHLANLHGTFYELPLVTNGAPPAWNRIRPVASHRKWISDFCSWNGLLVLAGLSPDAIDDSHVFLDADRSVGLWFGGVDDLWQLGKPVGHGGPWYESTVAADVASDAYLMTGYDQKTMTLSHEHQSDVTFTVQVDVDGTDLWVDYDRLTCPANQEITHRFPDRFSACWVRLISDTDTKATAQLVYE
ncbi:sulfatase-like hydrolase/transferase [Crateriforma conspicua]|uniref:sulfatase-like hydrolase/transferase n=1 Tax=Crateriforma conspicua TaxID=2527996 RepID=UPI001188E3E4|nr:sulfatase-like hydrolase/transferase [Crateriforma conspicua]QDV63926.1 Choline-sulfatase [Crateriforma conspicua]